ncbi:MAG: hypothetical protein C0601_13005 [Candidatus Muiribacterium halophilum]|uniref:GGDEF domain-containing protein n=1 Tax=Muiribacterium halophilum TaxID=2053465 RepID=A0A2N5Z9L9_MUIH1|nr:MAG: hypothetical protein C0601_13005 [Candidatus Muirbacterium halophilum]
MLGPRIKYLFDIIHKIYSYESYDELINAVVEQTSQILEAKRVSLMLYDNSDKMLRIVASKGVSKMISKKAEVKLGEDIAGRALKEKKVYFVEDINTIKKKLKISKKRSIKSGFFIVIPLYLGENLIGTLNVTDLKEPGKISKRDKEIIISISSHIALAIERTKLLEFQKVKMQQAVTLFEISKTLNSFIEIEDTLESFIDILATLLGISEIAIYIYQDNLRRFKLKKSFNLSDSMLEKITNYFQKNRDYFHEMDKSYDNFIISRKPFYVLPLRHETKIIGQLVILKKKSNTNEFDHDIRFLSILASQLAVILGKEILLEKIRGEKEKFRVLNHLGKELSSCFEMKKIAQLLRDDLHFMFNYETSVLLIFKENLAGANMFFDILDENGNMIAANAYEEVVNFLRINMKRVDESKINLIGLDPISITKDQDRKPIKSSLIMPLIEKDELLGVFYMASSRQDDITLEEDLELFSIIGNYLSVTIKKAMLFKENERLAFTDPMTDTFNYRFFKKRFLEEFIRAKRYDTPITLMILDIDYFKYFNDNFGHQQGDMVLREVAQILKNSVRTIDIVARYGGEEFVAVFPETDIADAVQVANRIRTSIQDKVFTNITMSDKKLHITVSIGLSSLNKDIKNISDFIDFSDACLYRAKNNGRNRVCFYDGEKYREEKDTDS